MEIFVKQLVEKSKPNTKYEQKWTTLDLRKWNHRVKNSQKYDFAFKHASF